MSNFEKLRYLREAGHIQRWHLLPHIGDASVAAHSWNMAVLLLELKPDASKELIKYVLHHDVQERWMGDLPHDAKKMFHELRDASKKAEAVLIKEFGYMGTENLTEEDLRWVAALDILEAYMWCLDQEAFGNKNIVPTIKSFERQLAENQDWIPEQVMFVLNNYRWERGPTYLRSDGSVRRSEAFNSEKTLSNSDTRYKNGRHTVTGHEAGCGGGALEKYTGAFDPHANGDDLHEKGLSR